MARSTKIKSKLIAEDSVEFSQLTPGTVPVLDADKNIVSSVVTPAELANLSGTTSPLQDQINTENEKIDDHIADLANPHQVTKTQVGLSNVDNTSDINKPISTATQDALDLKYDASNPSNFVDAAGAAAAAPVQSVSGKAGAVLLDKSDVGLGNVDNTSDLNKPISTATQDALDLKQDSLGFTPENVANKSTDVTLADNSDTLYPSQKAIKTYVDSSISSATIPDATSTVKGKIKLAGDLSGTADAPTVPELANKEPTITAGTTSQYFRGDKTFQELNKSAVGLSNVDNTSDANKPISTATQNALDLKYDATNPAGYVDAIGASAAAPVQSVAGRTGSITLSKVDVGLDQVDNTSDANKPISTATQNALNLKYDASNPAGYITQAEVGDLEGKLKYQQVVHVDKSNTGTYTADGSLTKPFKTIEAMYDAITDATASKRYACIIAPGTYTEASTIRMKGWIDLTSFATDTVIIGISGGATLKWSNNNPGRVFVKDIGFTSGLEILNDNPTGTSGMVFDLDNVDAPSLIFRGRGGGRDFIQLRNDTRISSTCTIQSAATTIFDSTNISTLVMNDVGCVAPDSFGSAITASLRSNYIGAVQITASAYDIYTDAWGVIIAGNLSITSNASSYPCYYNYDATSYPLGNVTLTGSNPAQLVATSKAQAIRYTPSVSGNWASPAPTEVKAALDSLAANKIASSEKGANNGVATLDGSGKVPAAQLPSYVDDVVEYADLASFPATGESSKIYVAIDTNICYRWSGTAYVQITSGAVASVNGQTGVVVLDSDDLNHQQANVNYWDIADNSTIKAHLDELAARREAQNALTKEPTGFSTRTECTTSFSDSIPDRTFTISPVSSSFTFYVKGVKFTKTTAETLQIPNLAGNHFIYYNDAGTLSSTQVASSSLFQDNALIAIVYWNTDTNTHSYFAEERHGLQMDGETHSYLHTVFGAQYLSGLALQGFSVDGTGNLSTDAQFTADEGRIRDEDLLLELPVQTQIPVLFRQGSLWRKKVADSFPMIYSGTAGYTGASGRLPYNQLLSGSWQLTEVSNNGFVLIHLFGTNDKETPIVAIQGIAEYGNITAARLAASSEITSLSGLPFAEFVALGSVVIKTADGFTNTPKAAVVSVDGANYVDFRGTQLYTPAGVATNHALLSGLGSDDHIQYHTDARGDARYYTKPQVDALIGAGGSAGDISEKEYNFSNSQIVAENITDFAFSNSEVRGFNALVTVEIDATTSKFEQFILNGIQKSGSWDMSIESTGDDSGVVFSITNSGQVQYTSTNNSGFVSGAIKFRATTTSI